MTLTFYRLGKVNGVDASAYGVAQVFGGLTGIGVAALLLAPWVGSPSVRYVATLPGAWGLAAAFAGEALMTFVLMTVVLHVSNHARWSRFTGVCAATLVVLYITFENPISGMSMNAARSLGPAILAGELGTFWIYLAAPPLGMLAAAELYVRTRGAHRVFCAKLHHHTSARCIFHCRFDELAAEPLAGRTPSTATSLARGH
jgi:aquaporin Z